MPDLGTDPPPLRKKGPGSDEAIRAKQQVWSEQTSTKATPAPPENPSKPQTEKSFRPGISATFLRRHNIRHVDAMEAATLIGQRASGIAIPYRSLESPKLIVNGRHFHRLRLDNSRNCTKYLSPTGGGAQLYIPKDISFGPELAIAEAEFKGLALAEEGVCSVAIGGICSMMPKGALLPELKTILSSHQPKIVLFIGDADTSLIYDFSREATKLATLLGPGIIVRLPRIPIGEPNGIDDCREKFGPDFSSFWSELVDQSIIVKPKTDPSILAVDLVIRELKRIAELPDTDLYIHKIAALGSRLEDPISLNRLSREVRDVFGIAIPAFQKATKLAAAKRKKKAQQQAETEKASHDSIHAELVAKCGPPFTDTGGINESYFVQRFAREHQVLYEQDERVFFRYVAETGAWQQVDKDVIKEAIRADWEQFAPTELLHLLDDRLLNSLVNGVKSFAGRIGVFKRLPLGLLHLKNGMLKITSSGDCQLLPFNPQFYSRNPILYAFNPKATAPHFLAMLNYPLDKDDANLLLRLIGSCLLEGNHAQRFGILEGKPLSAKTTIANIVTGLVGRQNAGELRTHLLEERFEVGRLIGKTLLTARDVAGNFLQQRSAYVLKKLVGHDYLDGEIKGSMKTVNVTGDFALLITSNETLLVWLRGETDAKSWGRRIIIITFTKSVDPKDRIDNLDELLLREEGEGILLLAIKGAIKHLKELENGGDFVLTKIQQDRVDKLLSESQSVRFFVQGHIVPDPNADLSTDEIVSAYADFCKTRGWKTQPGKVVERQLPDLMLEIHTVRPNHHIPRGGSQLRGYSQVSLLES